MMEFIGGGLSWAQILAWVAILFILWFIRWSNLGLATMLSVLTLLWFKRLEIVVPEPYLVSKVNGSFTIHVNHDRMRFFISDKLNCISKAAGTSGIPK